MTFTAQQPKDGETIMHCGHVEGSMHWFQYDRPVHFQRLDGSRGSSCWFAACEACFVRRGVESANFVRGDAVWTGDEPTIRKMES